MSSQGKHSLKEVFDEYTTIKDEDNDEDEHPIVHEEREVNGTKTPARPTVQTPPSSQRASRGGTGVQHGYHPHTTPSSSKSQRRKYADDDDDFIDDGEEDDEDHKITTSTPSKKRKQNDTPSKVKSSKWEAWEDKIILKAVLLNGMSKCDWEGVLHDINLDRPQSDPRTAKAVSCHWATLKSKLIG